MAIKIGNLDISSVKVGSADCAVYLGTVKLYPTTPPSFNGKYKFTLTDDSVVSGECDASSAITTAETSEYTAILKEIVIGDCVTSIGAGAFIFCRSLTSCTIGSGVTSIGRSAFQECISLTSIDIPDSVTSISNWAFLSCSGLTNCTIGSGLTSIGHEAFSHCSSLTSIDIPDSVTSIGRIAFDSCSGLTSITVNATTPPTLGDDAFLDTNSNLLIYVPAESVNAYKTAWSTYADRIQAIPSSSGIPDNYVIPFEDSNVKTICVNNWGGNVVAGEITYGEAKQVTDIGTVFANNSSITSFNELAYFHGLTTLNQGHFAGCSNLRDIVIPSNVTSIGRLQSSGQNIIFKGCGNLSGLTMLNGDSSLYFSLNAENNSYYMNSSHSSTPMVFPDRPMEMSNTTFAYYDYCNVAYFQSATPPTNLANSDINNYYKLQYVYCPVGSLSAYQTALAGKNKTVQEYDFETDSLGLLDKQKEWESKTSGNSV